MMPVLIWITLALAGPAVTHAEPWTAPVDVFHEAKRCISYRAAVQGEYLVVRAMLEPSWHTFTMDNKRRAAEKLAGKPSLGIDQPTEIRISGGLAPAGPWHQSPPKDFSKPDLRWFSWGFENEAIFAVKVRRTAGAAAGINIRGQACTDSSCKNIDVELSLPLPPKGDSSAPNLQQLVEVR